MLFHLTVNTLSNPDRLHAWHFKNKFNTALFLVVAQQWVGTNPSNIRICPIDVHFAA